MACRLRLGHPGLHLAPALTETRLAELKLCSGKVNRRAKELMEEYRGKADKVDGCWGRWRRAGRG